MSPHLNREAAEQYVLGALTPEATTALEQHTLGCAPCARILQGEALLDEQLRELARTPPPQSPAVRPARWRKTRLPALVGGMLAIAAALLLLVLRPGRPAPPSTGEDFPLMAPPLELSRASERLVACPDPTSQDTCIAQAQAHGLLVQYPEGAGEVPRYDGHAGFRRELAAGPSLL
jgi:anti-sigma factor RsiW